MQISKATSYGPAYNQVFVRVVKKLKLKMFSCSISNVDFCEKIYVQSVDIANDWFEM